MLAFLQKNALFQGFSARQLQQIAAIAETKHFQNNEVILKEQEISDYIYLIQTGAVEVRKYDKADKQQHHLAFLKSGDVIGEMSLFDQAPHSASVIAIEPTTIIALNRQQLKNISNNKQSSLLNKITYRLIQ